MFTLNNYVLRSNETTTELLCYKSRFGERKKKRKKSEAFDNSIIVRAQGNLSYNGSPKCLFLIYTVQSQWNF